MAAKTNKRFVMNVMDVSYFSGKLECFFRYKQIDYQRNEASWSQLLNEIYPHTATMQVPTVYDSKHQRWLRDTTAIMEYIENDEELKQNPCNLSTTLSTNKLQCFVSYLLEDFFDEWLWRNALYYRWNFDVDADHLSMRFLHEFMDQSNTNCIFKCIQQCIIKHRQRSVYITGDGIKGPKQKQFVEMEYMEILSILNDIFEERPFLFGDAPCFADFGLFASMFRHFSLDPTPRKLMLLHASNVYEWVARMWNAKMSKLNNKPQKSDAYSLEVLYPLLRYYVSNYLKYLYLNETAYAEHGENGTFDVEVGIQGMDKCVLQQLKVVPFRVWCRVRLQRKFEEIQFDEKERRQIEEILRECGCWEYLWKTRKAESGGEYEVVKELETLPLCKKPDRIGKLEWFMLKLNGTPKWKHALFEIPVSARVVIVVVLLFLAVCAVYVY